ncbi:MAG: hypothetical protein ACI4IR_04275 [Eubacterium sp.]
MKPKAYDNCVLISNQQYEKYNKMKGYKNRTGQNFDKIYTFVHRLVMLSELLNSGIYEKEEIERDMELTIDELYTHCENYRNLVNSFDDCEF